MLPVFKDFSRVCVRLCLNSTFFQCLNSSFQIPVFSRIFSVWYVPCTMHIQPYLIVFPVNKSQFELELCGVYPQHPGPALPVQTVHTVTLNTCDVDRQIQGADYSMVTVNKKLFFIVKSFLVHIMKKKNQYNIL